MATWTLHTTEVIITCYFTTIAISTATILVGVTGELCWTFAVIVTGICIHASWQFIPTTIQFPLT